MDNPLVFLGALIGFFFVVWFIGGGQHWAISYQGPYITPITNVGQVQFGYGPQLFASSSVSLPGSSASSSTSVRISANASPFAGKITLAHTTQSSTNNPNQQYLEFTLTSHESSPTSLYGWKFVSIGTQSSALISNTSAGIGAGQTILIVTKFPSSDTHDTMQLYDGNGALVGSATF